MPCNMGKTDMTIRIILGIVLIALFFVFHGGTIGVISLVVGIIALVTGVFRFCPLYAILKVNTGCKSKK